jgi:hypothetical protein
MAAKQMEDIQRKLGMLNYSRANAPAQSLLFAGMERYALLEWLFFKYPISPYYYLVLCHFFFGKIEVNGLFNYWEKAAQGEN